MNCEIAGMCCKMLEYFAYGMIAIEAFVLAVVVPYFIYEESKARYAIIYLFGISALIFMIYGAYYYEHMCQ